jgi:hypothetical protein
MGSVAPGALLLWPHARTVQASHPAESRHSCRDRGLAEATPHCNPEAKCSGRQVLPDSARRRLRRTRRSGRRRRRRVVREDGICALASSGQASPENAARRCSALAIRWPGEKPAPRRWRERDQTIPRLPPMLMASLRVMMASAPALSLDSTACTGGNEEKGAA